MFISSGETTTLGRVFCISDPAVGSSDTSQTSSTLGSLLTSATPHDQTGSRRKAPATAHRRPTIPQLERHRPILDEAQGRRRRRAGDLRCATEPCRQIHTAQSGAWVSECPVNCRYVRFLLSCA